MRHLEHAIARLWSTVDVRDHAPKRVVVGAGFLVGDVRHILTCHHVVERCIPKSAETQVLEGARVQIDFPLLSFPSPLMEARVDFARNDDDQDLAGLTLLEDPPAGVEPATLIVNANLWEHRFKAFGVPDKADAGEWAHGKFLGPNAQQWIQIEAEKPVGRRVKPGYSGAPVYDLDLHGVAGMVVRADKLDTDRVAFMLPTKVLVQAWSDVLADKAIGPCPYRGINPFEESDSDAFFGREDLVEQIIDKVQQDRFIAILADSGSGKSSLLRAGVATELRRRPGWTVAFIRGPGKDPFLSFAEELLNVAGGEGPSFSERARSLAEGLSRNGLRADTEHALKLSGQRRMLVVIDQFEELFTQCRDDGMREKFLNGLVELCKSSRRESTAISVVVAGRSDYMTRVQQHKAFAKLLRNTQIDVPQLSEDAFRRAIEKPAVQEGIYFEGGLVDRIVREVQGQPASLPHLQYTLTQLWYEQEHSQLTETAYERIGGVHRALEQQADRVYEALPEFQQEAARRIFVQLVHLKRDAKGAQRPVTEADLLNGDWTVVEKLADQMLITTGLNSEGHRAVQLAHEALVDAWPRLRDWVNSAAEQLWMFDRDADRVIKQHIALVVGAAAIPWADVVAVGAVYASMGRQISRIYGIDVDKGATTRIARSMVLGAVTVLGAWYTNVQLFKTTGAGYFLTWTIEAPLLSALTYAIGNAWKYYFGIRFLGGGEPTPDQMRELVLQDFKNRLRKWKKFRGITS